MGTSVVVCIKDRFGSAASCAAGGGVALADLLEQELARQGLAVPVKRLLCFGRCNEGPNIRIAPGGAFFTAMSRERLPEVVAAVQAALAAETS
ncbi:MAG: (2Fe-2S) ferredoxin domain-containing protein [Magnetococcales bacterium]|nr:(2Fe-2S) ferredoxin domain-containing protein [Magnetococcales bacterium]